VAEHIVSVQLALKNKMDLSVEVATSSSLANCPYFVAPLLVFISLLLGPPPSAYIQSLRTASRG